MNLDEKKKKSGVKYYAQIDKAVKKQIPYEEPSAVKDAIDEYTSLQEELQERKVTVEDVETLVQLVEILKREVRKYHGKSGIIGRIKKDYAGS